MKSFMSWTTEARPLRTAHSSTSVVPSARIGKTMNRRTVEVSALEREGRIGVGFLLFGFTDGEYARRQDSCILQSAPVCTVCSKAYLRWLDESDDLV